MSRLRLHIDGEPGAISLQTYLGILGHSMSTLRVLDRAISGQRKGTLEWFIEEVHTRSSVVTDLRSVGDRGSEVNEAFISGMVTLEEVATVPAFFSEDEMRNIGWIARQLRHDGATGFHALDLDSGATARVTEITEAHVKEATAARFEGIGSVTGTLEMVSIHGGAKANIYQTRTRKAVRCNIPKPDQEELLLPVTAALGRVVIASGRIYRNAQGEPIRLTLRSLTPIETPDPSSLPTADDIAGSNPDITDGLSVDEHMRRLRDA